jgi:hypothetical protein
MQSVTGAVTIETDVFGFAFPVAGLQSVPTDGTLLAGDGAHNIRTPCDECVRIMPTRRPRRGEAAVRLGRIVS